MTESKKHQFVPRVLAVDDEPENLEIARRALESEFSLEVFTDPRAAIQALESNQFDLVLADQRMPNVTGVELLKRTALLAPRTRRVILSAFTEISDLMSAINDAQIHRYLTKPIHTSDLLNCVRGLTAGCAPGLGYWLVCDGDSRRGREIANLLSEVSGEAEVELDDKVEASPELSLVLMVGTTPEELERVVVDELGGPRPLVSIMVALPEGDDTNEVDYLRAGAQDVVALPLSAVEFSMRLESLVLSSPQ